MINFALIGCGRIAKRHAELLGTGQIAGARLAAVCDIVPERAREYGERYKVPHFTSVDDLLASKGIDAVSVLTPSGSHADIAVKVAQSHRHVVVASGSRTTLRRSAPSATRIARGSPFEHERRLACT